MSERRLQVALITAAWLFGSGPVHAAGPCNVVTTATCVEASTKADSFGIAAKQGSPERIESPGSRGGRAGVDDRPMSTVFTEALYIPTCTGNRPGGQNDLCAAAQQLCVEDDLIRFWVYTREVHRQTGPLTDWQLRQQPPFVCIGPEDPAVAEAIDPAVLIAAMVQRDFQRLVVLKGVADVSPSPDTLINVPTRFSTQAPASYDIPLTLLGQSVTITATARRWVWHFGDGTSAATTAAGTNGRVEHVYHQPAQVGASVDIDWSGTFRIGGGPSQPISGLATTVGDPTALAVKQARTELVAEAS